MAKYSDEEIRQMSKITCKIAADYLGVSPMAVSFGMREEKLPAVGFDHNILRFGTLFIFFFYHVISTYK